MNDATILFLAANPSPSSHLALDREARDIEARIQLRSCSIPLVLRTRWAVSPDDLLLALNQDRPVVVHFSGHGAGPPGLLFHDEDGGGATLVTGKALQRLFRALKDDVRVVVLNACYSEDQARPICEVVDCVVGMSRSIGDRAARMFAAAFYRALGHGRDVQNAFDQGLVAIDLAGLGEEDIPRLLVRAGVTASDVRLRAPKIGGDRATAPARGISSGQRPSRCVITLHASLEDITPEMLAKLTELLRLFSGDRRVTIESVEEGSVRLTIVTTEAGRARLIEAARRGEVLELAGFQVLSVKTAERAAHPEPISIPQAVRVARLARRAMDSGGSGIERAMDGLSAEVDQYSADFRRALRTGDARVATEALMRQYGLLVREYCRRLLGSGPDAEDVSQVVFMHTFEAIRRGDRPQQPRSWLFGLARQRCTARLMRSPRHEPGEPEGMEHAMEPAEHVDVAAGFEMEAAKQVLRDCLDRLAPGIRAAVVLRLADGLSYDEIAKLTDSNVTTSRTRVARGLAALRECLKKKGQVI